MSLLTDPANNRATKMNVTQNSPGLNLYSPRAQLRASLQESGPSLFFQDEAGFATMIGGAEMMSDAEGKRKTSAASLVLTDSGGNVIWRAPAQ
jgi:hypothetical protein